MSGSLARLAWSLLARRPRLAEKPRQPDPGIPLNASAIDAVVRMLERAGRLGHREHEHYLASLPLGALRSHEADVEVGHGLACATGRGPARPPGSTICGTRSSRAREMGVADHVVESIGGYLSQRMLEHYSHIRIDAKREARDALDAARRKTAPNGIGNGDRNSGKGALYSPASVTLVL